MGGWVPHADPRLHLADVGNIIAVHLGVLTAPRPRSASSNCNSDRVLRRADVYPDHGTRTEPIEISHTFGHFGPWVACKWPVS